MKNSRVAFNFLDRYNHAPVGYKKIKYHQLFDVKMDLTRKSRYVAGGHLTDPLFSMNYESVVCCVIVHLAFIIAVLNYLDILSGKI